MGGFPLDLQLHSRAAESGQSAIRDQHALVGLNGIPVPLVVVAASNRNHVYQRFPPSLHAPLNCSRSQDHKYPTSARACLKAKFVNWNKITQMY